jgi:ubiquinone biosynthesis protein Coq4/drug/metabolite transporter (DMT)-like permease
MTTRSIAAFLRSPAAAFAQGSAWRNLALAIVLMLVASALFAVQAALVKTGLAKIAPLELVFFRGLVCAALIFAFARLGRQSLASTHPAGQLVLGAIGFISMALYFVSIGMLPLVTATALNYSAPLFLALIIGLRQGRKASAATQLFVAAGFAGVCILLQPSFVSGSAAGLLYGLLSGITGAICYLLLGRLGHAGEPQRVTAFYFSLIACVLAGIPTLFSGFSIATQEQVLLVLAIGLLATFAQLAVVKAYAISSPLIPATLSYSAIVFSSIIGALWWGDQLGFGDALGIALIVASGVLVSAGQANAGAAKTPTQPLEADEQLRKRDTRRNNLRSLYATFMLGKHPDQVKYVFMMGDAQDNIAEGTRLRGEISDPFAREPLEQMWRSRFAPARYDADSLLQLAPDTLGGAYARHMRANGLRPDFYEDMAPRHRMHYLRLRMRQTHDIWHVLSGFGTDEFGEVGLQGFYFAQFTNGQSALIACAAMLKSVLRGRFGDLEKHVDAFCEGYCNGKRAQSLLAVKWEELWGEKLETLRQRYGVAEPQCRAGRLVPASA